MYAVLAMFGKAPAMLVVRGDRIVELGGVIANLSEDERQFAEIAFCVHFVFQSGRGGDFLRSLL